TAVRIGAALCVLAAISAIAWRLRNRAPYVVVGWLWYLGTLAPVIGIIQVGTQSIADRYTYIPMIGLLIMSAWGIHDLVSTERWVTARRAIGAVSCVLVVVLAALTWSRMGIWRDSETLYRSTLQTMPDNAFANMGLGQLLVDRKQYADAVPRLETAIHKRHREPEAHYHLGIALQALGQLPKAEEHYRAAVALDPANSLMWNNFGVTLDAMGRPADALAAFERASALGPRNQEAAGNLVRYLARMGRIDDALREASAAAARMPESGDIQSLLATLHAMRTAPPTPAP
ncbi:MAG: tetratricopeptide repeat protein, partial [Candidatus Hydrogenedentes bacterium]|nr:tetratricopeptide repeat protein [Candidatus Hydrogenedentota bacterium]